MFTNENPFEKVKNDGDLSGLEMLRKVLLLFLTNEDSIRLVKQIPDSVRESPQLIAKQIKDCKTVIIPYIKELIEIGNADGSLQVSCPTQAAEMVSYLVTMWVSPQYSQSGDEVEFKNVIDTFSTALVSVGLPILDQDTKGLIMAIFKKVHENE